MCVLSIKVPVTKKKSGNLFNDPRTSCCASDRNYLTIFILRTILIFSLLCRSFLLNSNKQH